VNEGAGFSASAQKKSAQKKKECHHENQACHSLRRIRHASMAEQQALASQAIH
jgi:hypothetical protein